MLWVYDHYKCFTSFSAGSAFILQNLSFIDKDALKGLISYTFYRTVCIVTIYLFHLHPLHLHPLQVENCDNNSQRLEVKRTSTQGQIIKITMSYMMNVRCKFYSRG